MGDPKEPDVASIECYPETHVCSSCEEVVDQLEFYRCSSCNDCGNSNIDPIYCDLCISPHVKKKHEVLDSKGYRPAVCEVHKTLCTSFCETCQIVFCSKCTELHFEHKLTALSEKARGIRKEIFKYLEDFDKLSKPFAERQNAADASLQDKKDAFPDLSMENFGKSLCNNFERIVQENSSKWENLSAPSDVVHAISDKVDFNITTLRSMLTMSDGVFVSHFLNSKASFDSSIREQEAEVESHGNAKWCRTLDSIISYCINDVIATWKLPAFERRAFRKLQLQRTRTVHLPSKWERFVYDLTNTKSEISFSYWESKDVSISKRYRCSNPGNQRFLCKYRNVVSLIDDEKNCVSLYSIEASKLVGNCQEFSKKLKILGVFEVVAVRAFPSVEQVFTLFYWNEVSSCAAFNGWLLF